MTDQETIAQLRSKLTAATQRAEKAEGELRSVMSERLRLQRVEGGK